MSGRRLFTKRWDHRPKRVDTAQRHRGAALHAALRDRIARAEVRHA